MPNVTDQSAEDTSLNRSYLEEANYNGFTRVNAVTTTTQESSLATEVNFRLATQEQMQKYVYPDISNDKFGNILDLEGNVTLERFSDHPLPQYLVELKMQPDSNVPVEFDAIRVDFSNGNKTKIAWISEAHTSSQNYTENSTEDIPSITLQSGQKIRFFVDSANALNFLLMESSTGNTTLSVAVYNKGQIIGAFHARLPTVYETNGQAPEITVGEEQEINFRDYVTVEKEVDANFYENHPYYAQQRQ